MAEHEPAQPAGGVPASLGAGWIIAGLRDWLTVVDAVEGSQPLVALAVTSRRHDEIGAALGDLVLWSRQNGATWEAIGAALGLTRQGAWDRWHYLERSAGPGQSQLGVAAPETPSP